ncbi:hypothetical protein [Paenibacillus radicis (ex Xue et al. 2023)]|uniref:LexA family protein n=1 Tax=Paenibacillus radicis (ex Xue et al. 2023) TaxID=2972489 RepID=UPI003AF31A35
MSRQQAILDFITSHNKERGYSPTIREIGDAVGLRSSATVSGYIGRLENDGLVRRVPSSARTLEVISIKKPASEVRVIESHMDVPRVIEWQDRRYVYVPVG